MSFILDALKKSENERQRQSGPALFEAKVAPPKPRWPAWAFALAALLLVNIGVVVWLLLRSPSDNKPTAVPVQSAPAAILNPAVPVPPPPLVASAPVGATPAPASPPLPASTDEATTSADEGQNPEDYEPAVEPGNEAPQAAAAPQGAQAIRGTAEGLPTYEEIAAKPGNGLPDLRLDLHVFAAKPQDRFVFLNMRRLREGDSLPEGVLVDSISPDGVILSFRGTKFVLRSE